MSFFNPTNNELTHHEFGKKGDLADHLFSKTSIRWIVLGQIFTAPY